MRLDKSNSEQYQSDKDSKTSKKQLVVFLLITALLVILGLILYALDDRPPMAQAFFEERKTPKSYHEYKKEEMTAKEKAERNIFLQD